VFKGGEYEDGVTGNSTWAEGDWNCDGEFDTGDLVAGFRGSGYNATAVPASAITHPATWKSIRQAVAAVDAVMAGNHPSGAYFLTKLRNRLAQRPYIAAIRPA
jgi:hypothetical protein